MIEEFVKQYLKDNSEKGSFSRNELAKAQAVYQVFIDENGSITRVICIKDRNG